MEQIRISRLKAPFVYRTMAEIELMRNGATTPESPHRHDHFTIMLVKNAEGSHQVDFQQYDFAPNMVFFISPEQIHHVHIEQGIPDGQVLMFTPDFLLQYSILPERLSDLDLFFNCDEAKPLHLSAEQMKALQLFLSKIAAENATENVYRWEAVGAWLKLLLLELRRMKSTLQQENIRWDKRKAEIVRQFKHDVEAHFREWHQVQQFAEAQNLSSNYLNEVIKAETGTSAKDFIQNRLLLEAKRLAQYSDLSAKQIAFALGYEDVAQFSKFFKKGEGVAFSLYVGKHEPNPISPEHQNEK